jgi:hypothetical protein
MPKQALFRRVSLCVFSLVFGFVLALWYTRPSNLSLNVQELPGVENCVANYEKSSGALVSANSMKDALSLCWREISMQGRLNDFALRRLSFARQYYAGPIILWMVVIITLSGVLLAAAQLYMAFSIWEIQGESPKRPEMSQTTDLRINREAIAFRSSVTGVTILFISLGFFIVFIKYVYMITPIDYDDSPKSELNIPQLEEGGLGPAPPTSDRGLQPSPP